MDHGNKRQMSIDCAKEFTERIQEAAAQQDRELEIIKRNSRLKAEQQKKEEEQRKNEEESERLKLDESRWSK